MERHEFMLIESDEAAMKLALAWSSLQHEDFEGEDTEGIFEAWAEAAGVPELEAHRCAPILFAHSICLPDGSLDLTAQSLITAKLAVRMRAARAPAARQRMGRP